MFPLTANSRGVGLYHMTLHSRANLAIGPMILFGSHNTMVRSYHGTLY